MRQSLYEDYIAWRACVFSARARELQEARPRVAMMPMSEALMRGERTTGMRRVTHKWVENGVTYTVTKWVARGSK